MLSSGKLSCLILFILVIISSSVAGQSNQDPGEPDTLDLVVTVSPNAAEYFYNVQLQLWYFNDASEIYSAEFGFHWDDERMLFDTAYATDLVKDCFEILIISPDQLIDIDTPQVFPFAGVNLIGPGLPPAPERQLWATYDFHIFPFWTPQDTITIDTMAFYHGFAYFIHNKDNQMYKPVFGGPAVITDGDQHYNPANGHAYKVYELETPGSWQEVMKDAELKGGYLATITTSQEQSFVYDVLDGYTERVWLGGSDSSLEGRWRWATGEPWLFSFWGPDQPVNFTGDEDYLVMNIQNGGDWEAYSGDASVYLVEWGEYIADDREWFPENGHYYKYFRSPRDIYWKEANYLATLQGGYLATVTDEMEDGFIKFVLDTNSCAWLGATDSLEEGIWQWITGERWDYTDWADGQPDNLTYDENYLMISSDYNYKWSDESGFCNGYIVEWGDINIEDTLVNIVQWRKTDGGNDHWYALLNLLSYKKDAAYLAANFLREGLPGYLATVTSSEENDFILNMVIPQNRPPSILDEYWLGGEWINGEWAWVTGEPFDYLNWSPNEPSSTTETSVLMWGHTETDSRRPAGAWNDASPIAFPFYAIVEWGESGQSEEKLYPTYEWMNIYCGEPTLNGHPLKPGDEIKVYDDDGILCGRGYISMDSIMQFIPIYRDDIYSDEDEGADPGDTLSFKINGHEVNSEPPVTWTALGDRIEVCQFFGTECLKLNLDVGWHLVSWNVDYQDQIENFIEPFADCIDLVQSFDQEALIYDPDMPEFSTLGEVDYYHGYWLKVKCPVSIEICGEAISNEESIPVFDNWNLVSSWLCKSALTDTAFIVSDPVTLNAILGFELGYRIYKPDWLFSTLTDMAPYLGYWVQVEGDGFLAYPGYGLSGIESNDTYQVTAAGNEFKPEITATPQWISLYGYNLKIDGHTVPAGSEITAVSETGQKVGRFILSQDGKFGFMPVYAGMEPGGFSPGDRFSLIVNSLETEDKFIWTENGEQIQIENLSAKGTQADTPVLPKAFILYQNYPNPFNPVTRIVFYLPRATEISLEIYNIMGQKVTNLAQGFYQSGEHQLLWDAGQFSSGIYFYKLKSDSFSDTKKMLLLK